MFPAVAPGEVRAKLPASPPEHGRAVRGRAARPRRADHAGPHALEPPALLRVLREHRLGAGDPRRAADRGAERERDGVDHLARRRPSSSRSSSTGSRELLGLPAGLHGHIEDTASTSTLAALAAARAERPGGVVYRLRAGALLGREGGAAPRARAPRRSRSTTSSGCCPDFPLDDATAVVATVGTTSTTSVDPVPELAGALRGGGRLAPRRRRLCRLGRCLPRAPLVPRGRRPRRLDRRQPAQVAVHAGGLLDALDAAARVVPRGVRRVGRLHGRAPRARSTSATTARRSGGASARSSSGRCCAATAARGCRR